MNGLLVLLLYAACLIMGFFGGIFGYFYADYRKRKEQEKHCWETTYEDC